MTHFEPTRDAALVRALFSEAFPTFDAERPGVYEEMAATHLCLVARDEGEIDGLYLLRECNPALAEVHFTLRRRAWGPRSLAITRAFLAWVWANTGYQRLIGAIDTDNRLALRHAERAGFEVWGYEPRAMLKRGRLRDVVIVGLFREVKTC